jgi:hypothetical protein
MFPLYPLLMLTRSPDAHALTSTSPQPPPILKNQYALLAFSGIGLDV